MRCESVAEGGDPVLPFPINKLHPVRIVTAVCVSLQSAFSCHVDWQFLKLTSKSGSAMGLCVLSFLRPLLFRSVAKSRR